LSVGRIDGGRWSSQVPGKVVFEGRVGVRVDETVEQARAKFEAVVAEACPEASIAWTGGQFAPGSTDSDAPFPQLVRTAAAEELGAPPPFLGVPYGSDMRLFCERGIPCVMFGTPGIELAHAVDERVRIDDLVTLARAIIRLLASM
jgi:acetylornithine deacetylase